MDVFFQRVDSPGVCMWGICMCMCKHVYIHTYIHTYIYIIYLLDLQNAVLQNASKYGPVSLDTAYVLLRATCACLSMHVEHEHATCVHISTCACRNHVVYLESETIST